ncbi:flagellar basal body L-ring protein FlgH [Shewanella yunxiaonensis]|uniref:Flagellar L-ring protein n=1 Tax=Shewanella yunxiaonensis TaxID=2829809 RepID=A0ABX7YVM1_9GAMM|nr:MULTISPECIES: flagellar basal body L-ring protein FlgH [Shewanella]MDF0532960.1 flagellar basal body L-ring protein FlgH [Shewanella sp. A32]QUN06840.1 flagellar basal body L-ring protein FlgH [Shewanella yunxiaonensis]
MKLILKLLPLLLLGACAANQQKPIPDDPYYAPVYPDDGNSGLVPTGSIFEHNRATPLFSDLKAHRVGDIVTIQLVESTQAKKSAANQISKGSDLTVNPLTAAGSNVTINGKSLDLGYSDSMDTKRSAGTDQSNSLSGEISANVIQVLGNGNLVVRGEKWITINNGDEFIRITGIVRPQDITTSNTVQSPRVANARIQYSGTGTFADSQKVGWLSKFFMSDWWPF